MTLTGLLLSAGGSADFKNLATVPAFTPSTKAASVSAVIY
jgi:hypothetical protein